MKLSIITAFLGKTQDRFSEYQQPTSVRERLLPLIEATQADEVMITTMIFDHEARKHSYELLAGAFGIDAVNGQSK